MQKYWFPAPMLRLAISSASFNFFFFSETLHDNVPVVRAKQLGRSMKKTTACKKATVLPGGKEFDHLWNWFVKNKFPGALQLLK